MRKYTLNEDYFDVIDSSDKAYFLGFLFADGYNYEKRTVIEVACSIKDKQILEDLSRLIDSNKPLGFVESKGIQSYRMCLCSKKLSKRLSELGCMQNKSFKIQFPNIKEELISHFIRGYFDGDGCFCYYFNNRNSLNSTITIVSTLDFCTYLKNYFCSKLNVNSSIFCRHPENYNNNRTLQISGNRQVIKVMEYLYDNSGIYLERKNEKYRNFKVLYLSVV